MRHKKPNSRAEPGPIESDSARTRAVIDKLYALAVNGDVPAAALFLDRTLGPVLAHRTNAIQTVTGGAPMESAQAPPEPVQRPPVLLTVAEAAEDLCVSGAMIRKLVRTGQLGARRLGRRVLIPAAEIQRIMAAPSDHLFK